MSKEIVIILSLVGLISVCVAQVVQDGQCASIPLYDNFNIESFSEKWYEYARSDNPHQQGECSEFEVTNDNGLKVNYSSVNNNFLEEIIGTATQDGNAARLQLTLPSLQDPIDILVHAMMEDFFAIALSCQDISPSQRKLHIWILTRHITPSGMTIAFINTALQEQFGIVLSSLKSIDHSSAACSVLPVIGPGEPIILPGKCDENLAVVQNFEVDKFLGLWHQIASYETPNANGSCARAEYTKGDGVVNILNSQVVDQKVLSIDGYATVSGTDAKLSVVLNIPDAPPTPSDLWILRSDYENYAIAYSCINEDDDRRRIYSWILSRSRQLSPTAEKAVDEAIRSYIELNSAFYKPTNQSDAGCFFYPEPSDQPVVFRGQCESVNVQAMQNFEADKYMGIWHNIEMYPSRFQNGTCSNAFYEIVDGSVVVVNSQVNDQKLETIKGVAVPASDGSAKLVVTFPIPGSDVTASTDYWVLATDYTQYAFVYTCKNLNDNEMQVGSWKLSRTKQLSPNSELAINAIMDDVLYLDKRFYKIQNQTEGGCFYFPEPQDNVPVVFPGQCDETVAVIQNFNLADLEGIWYEIESYPKTERSGQCVNHQLTSIDTTRLNLVSSGVTDQFLGSLNGVVTRYSASENNGKLTIAITDANGQAKNVPFWILDANNDFVFAYGCENINDDFRAVWSWKLSRTRELSQAAQTAINNAMIGNDVLGDQYFEKIDHSNEACFYLPELDRGEPVILPGPCDDNIEGIPNFDIEKYAGRWRLIESYGSDFQDGTCNVARYTQQASNVLAVTNSQVVNGQLASISGTATLSNTEKGQLRFYFPSRDESFDVTILDTDYDSYSLGYGCVNIPNNQRRVYSWKMSRENTLSTDATNKMNQIIDTIPVLNNRFYYFINRTDTGCFYLPTPDPSTSVKFRGQCDQNIPVVTDFQAERYLGRWFDIESYPEEFQNGKCNTAVYSEHPDASIDVDVLNTQVINQTLFSVRGSAVQDPSEDASAKLTVTFNVGGVEVVAKYWVLATDYDTYSLVYSCRPVDDEYVQVTSWKLSRTRELTSAAKIEIDKVMSNIRVLEQQYFIARDHSSEGCFYFPEPQPGMPVVFPGQCNNSIEAVPNFNMKNFEGTWHETAGYPKANQDGQCISHQFTVNGTTYESMRLDSFEVLDLTQSTTEGHVTFARDDEISGKLVINIWVNGEAQSIPYWILSTNYNDYALVYSCINIDEETRGVWSWKLSRTRQLSDAGNVAINDAIAKIDVLRNEYYESIDQTDKACFHLPDITPGDNVILPGRCDSDIGGKPHFDIAKYAGEWRLIESYGSPQQVGTCNVAQYKQQDSHTLSVTNSQVVNGLLVSISGTATVSSNDGSGRLTFSLGGKEYNMYILETDYDSFAFAYGCENLENDRRRVTSWKFSRSNTLSQAAMDRINEIINDIEVLHQPYYYQVNRSPDACFYFPEPDRYTPVRFRGRCNESIPVVPDFNVEKYLGLWYDVESYPVAFQDGECPNARYSAINSSTVSVVNTQVIDQSLRSISGLAVASTDGSAKLKVTFDGQSGASDYWVLATDYDSYAFVYSCANDGDEYMNVASWKLSRSRELTADAKTKIDQEMSNIPVLDQRYFIERDQGPEACFYFPEPQPGVPVVFPGQCNESIEAVPNFSMKDFEGTWHEIAGYPKANQDGQCISQQFTVNGTTYESMRLDSFSVLDLTQSTNEGHVKFARDDDTSGKLVISISVNGAVQSIPYWILSTNYIDYALVYSCINIDEETRGVWSWKLSRTRQLSDAGNVAINDAIAKIDVLRNEYYESIDQTGKACFHLPDITPGDNVILPGRCDSDIGGKPHFDVAKYVGEWRLIESYGSPQQVGTCNVAQYKQQDSHTLSVTNSQVVNELLVSISGTATVSSNDGSGRLTFSLGGKEYNVYILETDYDSFAFAYGCENLENDRRRVTSWKFSRSNTLSQAAMDRINEIINDIEVLHQPYYYQVNRSPDACFYFPEPDRYTPVRFRGRCNESIPVVPDFNVERYLGLWYDIESYPVAFQDGECPNARYSAIDSSTVSVVNTQVVDQSLRSISGLAVASSDGSAKLKVTFDGQSGASDYWVLATDYDSYAFVYSCANDGDEYMNVASWKLSRTRELTAYAKIKIDQEMSNIPVLDQRYFIERDQGPEACFYFPEPQPGVPVVFPGQCNESIAAVPNFSMKDFEGTWHEIAGYPKANQDGQCISQQFTVNGTTYESMRLDSFSVFDQTQSTTEGHVTFASDHETSGKLAINIWVNGEAQSIPYWILSTNYNDYALVYSCINIDKETRGVWSWKLSRTRQLSDAGNVAINDAISNVDVLNNMYYENIQQADSDCFFYPELGPNDPVVFPGSCSPNIPVLQNFDPSRYLGRWRLIESYYSNFQNGTCISATYTVADDGSVIVVNSKVVDEQLNSITGSAIIDPSGSGKLTVTFPNSTPTEYWILDTDYDTFALIYTCVDLPNDQRRVWSWKMSRSNSLTDNAINAINEIINRVDVLDTRYYYPIDRTDVGCFYYPTPDRTSNVIFPGQCNESISVVSNFKADLYQGTWYDVESYPTTFQSGTCNTATYTLNSDGTLSVQNTQVVNQLLKTVTGIAVPSTDGSAKFDVTITDSSGNVSTTNYWILGTDYETYSFVYSCRNINKDYREVSSWKLGKQPIIPEKAENIINNIMDNVQVLSEQYYVQRDHTDEACFYYPDNKGGDVIIKGQCIPDADVPVVNNFNANAFSGVWHEVSRFPSAFQNSECTSSNYNPIDANTFNVIHTSVTEEEKLETETQSSVPTDGRGVISIDVDGVPFDKVYILDVEYNDYALLYSCRNLDADRKQLYSWKLSRSRSGLSEAANNAINELVSTNIDLHEPYYRTTRQDNEACFYYPVFDQVPLSIELPGPCNESIAGIPNFNMHDFTGQWYEIARYPQPAQTGQCSRPVFGEVSNSGTVTIVNSQVTDEALSKIFGEATVTGNDGQIEVTFKVGEETRTAKYYVLATDYQSYALLYSCVTIENGNRRRVGSWKLSRTTELSQVANNAIDSIVSSTQGLRQSFYQETSQTDAACFYYPEFEELPEFINLPGPCNTSITGVADFDVDKFIGHGKWFEVARYPQPAQTGQCNLVEMEDGATSNSLSFVTSQIFDESLTEIKGVASVISSDGSGNLRVTFNMDNSVSIHDFFVLTTDYTGYALLYTCSNNPDSNTRRVGSWKLSRNTGLSESAKQEVDRVIDITQGLKQNYYQETSHSDQACFHYPEQTGDKVIIPGQCDTDISAVESFNVARFANNSWYQIKRYDAVGDRSCIGTRLSFDEETRNITVLYYEVVNEDLLTTEGLGKLSSNDGSGIFTLVMEDAEDGEDTETTIYILATDYDGFALAYSCKNINSSQRQVGVWQLSRERTMTEAGKVAIADMMKKRPELHEPYFKPISHDGECLEPSSAFLFKSSIILIVVCTVLQLVW
ncbi:hypothetical protein PYW08_007808 [Mythimna loreyi]|uniref:Uncharacterized protein n=1 Tax=Mythimna loreyi TaxID=667449 RepID=A0ACC2QFA8_9NEOP|nr:hypothetical protein PYW08_007808 [Mythimna loreyi]